MFDELEQYLSVTTTPERRAQLIEAAKLLYEAGIRAHESDIERVLRMADQFTTDDNVQDLFSLLTNYSERTISSFGLYVSEVVPLGCQNHVLAGLLTIENYGDPEYLLGIAQREDTAEEKIIDILDAVTPLGWANFAPYIDQVSPALLQKIETSLVENLPDEEERPDLSLFRQRLKRHNDLVGEGTATAMIRNGVALGSKIEVFLEGAEESLIELEKTPEALANELVGILLATNLPNSELREMAKSVLEDFAYDINFVTKAHGFVIKQLANAIEVTRE
jgi:hypothetical protein